MLSTEKEQCSKIIENASTEKEQQSKEIIEMLKKFHHMIIFDHPNDSGLYKMMNERFFMI